MSYGVTRCDDGRKKSTFGRNHSKNIMGYEISLMRFNIMRFHFNLVTLSIECVLDRPSLKVVKFLDF